MWDLPYLHNREAFPVEWKRVITYCVVTWKATSESSRPHGAPVNKDFDHRGKELEHAFWSCRNLVAHGCFEVGTTYSEVLCFHHRFFILCFVSWVIWQSSIYATELYHRLSWYCPPSLPSLFLGINDLKGSSGKAISESGSPLRKCKYLSFT